MNVKLKIEEDAELRAYIKDCIRGQAMSIVREEFLDIVKEELEKKIKAGLKTNFEYLLKEALRAAVSNICYKEHNVGTWDTKFINPIVEQQVNKAISGKDWKTMVDTLAKEKVKSLIK